jgi:hypothetical protein
MDSPNPKAEAIQNPAEVANTDFFTKAALAAAWSPNPKKPPLFLDLPYQKGQVQPPIVAKWEANASLAMIDQYISSLRQYTALAMDVGNEDQPIAGMVETLDQVLQNYGIRHDYEVYPGNHINRIAERVEKKVLPFFAVHLKRPS